MAPTAVRKQKDDLLKMKVETKFWDISNGGKELNEGIDLMLKARKASSWFDKILNYYERAIEKFGVAWKKSSAKFEAHGEGEAVLKNSAYLEKQAYSELAEVFRGMSKEEKVDFLNEIDNGNSLSSIYGRNAPEPLKSPSHSTEKNVQKFNDDCVKFVDRLAEICERRARTEAQPKEEKPKPAQALP